MQTKKKIWKPFYSSSGSNHTPSSENICWGQFGECFPNSFQRLHTFPGKFIKNKQLKQKERATVIFMDRTCSCKMHCKSTELTFHRLLREALFRARTRFIFRSPYSVKQALKTNKTTKTTKKEKRKETQTYLSLLVCLSFYSSHRVNKSIQGTVSLLLGTLASRTSLCWTHMARCV